MITYDELLRRREAAAFHAHGFAREGLRDPAEFQAGEVFGYDVLLSLYRENRLTREEVQARYDHNVAYARAARERPEEAPMLQNYAGIITALSWALSQLEA